MLFGFGRRWLLCSLLHPPLHGPAVDDSMYLPENHNSSLRLSHGSKANDATDLFFNFSFFIRNVFLLWSLLFLDTNVSATDHATRTSN